MPAAERNLLEIVVQEKIAGKDWVVVKNIFYDIVRCIEHMHGKGVIHSDIKPLNIMRMPEGNIVIIDLDASVDLNSVADGTKNAFLGTLSLSLRFGINPTWK